MAIPRHGLTLEEFLALPEEKPALEFIDGLVTQKPMPGGHHSALRTDFMMRIGEFARPRRLAMVFPEVTCVYDGAATVPDISVCRWERIPVDARGRIADEYLDVPDLAIEITTPERGVEAAAHRCEWYLAHGIRIAVLVDAQGESVRIFRPGQPPQTLHNQDRIDLDEVLPGFELTVADLFQALYFGKRRPRAGPESAPAP